ncbi:hypothetical protein K438DRAFT_1961028 [Mycena galopus ATCC 62051]|nr:hypothetical protein K438DRAFT_1961028 [Mycena galopus ATCC 62051]
MMSIPTVPDDIAEDIRTNCVGFAAFTILIWDHLDTFPMEVEYIWRGKKGIVVYLFLLNRYLTPLGFIVNLFAYLSPVWTHQRYETLVCPINALYSTNRPLVAFVGLLWLVMFCMNAWLLTRGEPVMHNPESGVRACTMIFSPQLSTIASSSAWLPLLYDSVVLGLTLKKTLPLVKKGSGTYLLKRLLEDGLIYYAAIFSVTLVLTIMIVSAPPGLKNIAAQLELLITVTMMSRITLNLKKCAHKRLESSILRDPGTMVFQSVSFPTPARTRTQSYRNPVW